MSKLKQFTKKCLAVFLATMVLSEICNFHGLSNISASIRAEAKTTDYRSYSNTKKSWFIKRASDHQPPEGASTAKQLAKYHAYYYDSKTKQKTIYLTFDCGYENGYTGKLLDILKKHDVKAVFFVTKHFVKSQPKLCKRMKKEGHIVGNHTMNHPSMPALSETQIKNEIKGLEEIFKEETGYELDKYFRPPSGEYSDRTLKIVKDLGYTTVFWSMAYYDYDTAKQPGKQYVVDHFKKYYHKGAIPLMHNVSKSNAEALDEVLTFLEKNGYRCMRIDAIGKTSDIQVAQPQWDEDFLCEGNTSTKYIKLHFFVDSKKKQAPEGFEIYRKEKGGTYELIAVKKAKNSYDYTYIDRKSEPGKIYYYKVKSYCYLYGKKYMSSVAERIKLTVAEPAQEL